MSPWSSERGCRPFTFSEIEEATDSFRNSLGRGGEGEVFKGDLNDGSRVAVKKLNSNIKQDNYKKEISMLSKLRHTNLVSLRGYCQNSNQEKYLVYEFMSNGSLADNLYRKPAGFILSWEQRLNIAIGSACGLKYLHTDTSTDYKIIHRDVKPTNILLGLHWEAKVSDFGLSKRGPANQKHSSVFTERKGTIGYFAPEYWSSGKITSKVDVYAFGVVLFELLCKKMPWEALDSTLNKDRPSLAKWAERNIDPDLKEVISPSCLEVFIAIANKCVSSNRKQRPIMKEVVAQLNYALKLQKRDSENGKSAKREKHEKNTNPSANSEKLKVDSGSTKPPGGSEKRSLQHRDFKRSKSAKFEKNSQTENKKSAKQESTVASIKVVHSTKASSEEMKPGKETQPSSSGAAIKSGFRDFKILENFSGGSEATKEEDSTKSNSKETSTSLADIPGTEDKVVLYCSYTGVAGDDYMKIQFYLISLGVKVEERDPTVNREYELELRRFLALAQKQKEFSLPQLFIGGKYIGGAKEVDQLYNSGELGTSLEGYQH